MREMNGNFPGNMSGAGTSLARRARGRFVASASFYEDWPYVVLIGRGLRQFKILPLALERYIDLDSTRGGRYLNYYINVSLSRGESSSPLYEH